MKYTTRAALAALLTIGAANAATMSIDVNSAGSSNELGSSTLTGSHTDYDNYAPFWGDVTATANREGATIALFSDIGSGVAQTIQAGTYEITLAVGRHQNKAFVAYLDLSTTANTTSEGFTFGMMSSTPASEADASNAIHAFNTASGVTFTAVSNEIPPYDAAGPTFVNWTFKWEIATGSTVIGETASLGAVIQNMKGNSAYIDDGSITFTEVPEPSSAALLGLGGFALILRRRK